MNMNSREGLKSLFKEFSLPAESQNARDLQKYLALLEKWNVRINLTAKANWIALEPLFREGIWAAGKYPRGAESHLDIGSGAGFPAVILRLFVAGMRLEMVESRGKKGVFLETVAYELALAGTQVHTRRLAALLEDSAAEKVWDCISWKAIKLSTQDLLKLCAHTHDRTQFWMFHGKEAAVEEPDILESRFECIGCEGVPGQRDAKLSVYLPKF